MKLTTILKITVIGLTALLASCGEKKDGVAKDDHSGHSHAEGKHDDHEGHDHAEGEQGDEHEACGVVVGPNGGRLIKELAELNLTADGKLTLTVLEGKDAAKVTILSDGVPLELSSENNVYTSTAIAKFPVDIHVAIVNAAGEKVVEQVTVEAGKCDKCNNAKLACTCHNHDHGDHEGHDH